MDAWWERHPTAFEAEKLGLDALGHVWTIDQTAWASGSLIIHVEFPHEGELLKMTAEYPASYPYFPPQVFLEEMIFPRHQHPVGKNLCLLAREGTTWRPGHDTLAVLLQEQFPIVVAVNAAEVASTFVADLEDHVGEPFSSFLPYAANSGVIVPDETPELEHATGRLSLQVRPITPTADGIPIVNGILQKISDLQGTSLVEFSIALPAFSESMSGFWMRLPERPTVQNELEKHFVDLMSSNVPAFKKAIDTGKQGKVVLAGFVYPDETSWRTNEDDWIFLTVKIKREAKRSRPVLYQAQFIRADWGGEKAWMRRAPALRPLRTKSALLIGLGSLGSPLSIHLARAGIGKLDLVDHDYLQTGNSVRWALGWQYVGWHKAFAIADHMASEYPYTAAQAHDIHIGASSPPDKSDYELIRSACMNADVIIDATANHRVSHFLADLAQELGKPYHWLTTTHGAAGGVVGRIIPGKTEGCWHCFQRRLADSSIRLPADAGSDEIQPGGCSQPTFIGAGIDSDEIALLASRLAVASLSAGEPDGYPDFQWDISIGDLNQAGNSIAPSWTPYNLKAHPDCSACNSA